MPILLYVGLAKPNIWCSSMNLLSLLWQHVAFENSAWQLVFWRKLGLELLMVRKLLMSLTEWTFFTSWIVVVPFIIKLWCILPCALTSHKRNQTFCYHGRRKRSIGTMFWGKAILWLVNVLAKHMVYWFIEPALKLCIKKKTCTQVVPLTSRSLMLFKFCFILLVRMLI